MLSAQVEDLSKKLESQEESVKSFTSSEVQVHVAHVYMCVYVHVHVQCT